MIQRISEEENGHTSQAQLKFKPDMAQTNDIVPFLSRFYHWETTTPNNTFLRQPINGIWTDMTYAEAGREARKMAAALRGLGLQPKDHIGILSKNCYHWVLADLAIMMGGFVSVPFYASLPGDQLAEVVTLSDIKCLFVGKLDRWDESHVAAIPEATTTITFPPYKGSAEVVGEHDWTTLVDRNEPLVQAHVPHLDDLWTIKFTSGTTGAPKGVMLSHRAPSQALAFEEQHEWIGLFPMEAPRFFSFLPLNHVAERMAVEVPAIWMGGSISFSESLETFRSDLQATQPHCFFAVPRIWNNFYLGILSHVSEEQLDQLLSNPATANATKGKIRSELGLRDLKIASTGAAITPVFIKDFFKKIGVHLIEAYGMTETCGSIANGPMTETPADSVGQAIPWGDVKIDPDSGEVLMKTPNMMIGYYKNPEKTAEVLREGWLHSGDRGTIDDDGYLRIIGRVKDAFKTAKGSFVTPNPLEEIIGQNAFVEQACVVGLGLPQPIVLINLSPVGLREEKAVVAQSLQTTIEDLNAKRANFERISTAVIQTEVWSQENGLLTPTLKLKRHNFDQLFGEHYLPWHESPDFIVWS